MVKFEIRDLTSENLAIEAVCCEVENKDFQAVAEEKVAWLKAMMVKGLRLSWSMRTKSRSVSSSICQLSTLPSLLVERAH